MPSISQTRSDIADLNETSTETSQISQESTGFLDIEELRQKEREINEYSNDIFYSKRYNDDQYEYRHVILPKGLCKYYKADRLLNENEWRTLGVQQSPGWIHYMIHKPEPHVLLFRRELNYQEKYLSVS